MPVLITSAATGAGTAELRDAIFERVPDAYAELEPEAGELPATHRVYRPGEGDSFNVERIGPGAFRVEGGRIDRLIARHDVANAEALRYVEERLRALGVIRALEAAGFTPGDDVEIARHRVRARPRRAARVIQVAARAPPRPSARALPSRWAHAAAATTPRTSEQVVRDFVEATNERDGDTPLRRAAHPGVPRAGDRGDRRPGRGRLQAAARPRHRPEARPALDRPRDRGRRRGHRAGHDRDRRPALAARLPARQGGRRLEARRRLRRSDGSRGLAPRTRPADA